ncbi:MAG: nucleotidyltransferase family protein [Chthoniobacterales bacterium]
MRRANLHEWPVAILAGGLATRLRPITQSEPKALVSVAGEPFLNHQLRLLHRHGFRKVVLCLGYLGEMIKAYYGTGEHLDLQLDYSFDGPHLLGTGGALKRALPKLGDRFVVLYGDSYLSTDYARITQAFMGSYKPAMMTVYKNENRWDRSNVEFDGSRILRYDKEEVGTAMRYIDYGLGVFRSGAFNHWPENERFDLADVYKQLLRDGQLAGFEVSERFYEMGSPAGLRELEDFLRAEPAKP